MTGVDDIAWLRTADGAAATTRAAALQAAGTDLVTGLARLRAHVGADRAGPAWELATLRTRARPVFGPDADVLFFTADTLEQAGRPELAARRAERLLAGDDLAVADLGCGAGTDALALARAGAPVTAVDRDPVARALTAANAAALGLTDRVHVVDADVVDLVAGGLAEYGAATLDPARRAGGRRMLDPDRWSPPWATVLALLEHLPVSVVKVAPGLAHERIPAGVEAEWVSTGGSIVEALLWGPGRAALWRRATLVDRRGHVHELAAAEDPGWAETGPVRGWLHEPDPAAIRSGLVALLADDLDATLVDPTIAYLSSDSSSDNPWVTSYRVVEVLPFNVKKLKAELRSRGVGRVTVKKRGSAVEPEALARQLRGDAPGHAVVVVTRVDGLPTTLICDLPTGR